MAFVSSAAPVGAGGFFFRMSVTLGDSGHRCQADVARVASACFDGRMKHIAIALILTSCASNAPDAAPIEVDDAPAESAPEASAPTTQVVSVTCARTNSVGQKFAAALVPGRSRASLAGVHAVTCVDHDFAVYMGMIDGTECIASSPYVRDGEVVTSCEWARNAKTVVVEFVIPPP